MPPFPGGSQIPFLAQEYYGYSLYYFLVAGCRGISCLLPRAMRDYQHQHSLPPSLGCLFPLLPAIDIPPSFLPSFLVKASSESCVLALLC